MDRSSEKIELTNTIPLGLDKWIAFKQSSLTLAPGASQPLEIIYNTPGDVGFSYALAITLSPPDKPGEQGKANIQAKVAVFNLININRPDAKRELKIESFKSVKSRYEFLPAEFKLVLKNSGNVIDQPSGNLFIQRSFDDEKPIATIPLNKSAAYILPDSSRTFASSWNEGFPHYATEKTSSGEERRNLSWDWKQLGSLRMGKYVAKVVLVYNDGQRDVPMVASYTFWVIPWRLIIFTVLIGGLVVTGLVFWGRMIFKGTKKVRKYASRK